MELVEFQRQAAAELEELNPPEDAEEKVNKLIEALRERTEILEQATGRGASRGISSTRLRRSGENINEAFEQLRNEGFLPKVDEHEEGATKMHSGSTRRLRPPSPLLRAGSKTCLLRCFSP